MQLIPRGVAFIEGKVVVVGNPTVFYPHATHKVIFLPTDHYDFVGPVNVIGKTEDEISKEVANYGP